MNEPLAAEAANASNPVAWSMIGGPRRTARVGLEESQHGLVGRDEAEEELLGDRLVLTELADVEAAHTDER